MRKTVPLVSAASAVLLVCGVALLGSLGCAAAAEKPEKQEEARAAAEDITLEQLHQLQDKAGSEEHPYETQVVLGLLECQAQKYAADHGEDGLQEFIDKKSSEIEWGKPSDGPSSSVQEDFIRMGYSCSVQEARARLPRE
jgi:hypothetical protein